MNAPRFTFLQVCAKASLVRDLRARACRQETDGSPTSAMDLTRDAQIIEAELRDEAHRCMAARRSA